MPSIAAFMLNGHDSNYNMGISKLSKFTRLFNAVVYMAFFKKVITSTVCKCLILTDKKMTRQRMT